MNAETTRGRTRALLARAGRLRRAEPDSVYAYALWRSLLDLSDFFENEDEIPPSLHDRISALARTGINDLIAADAADGETEVARKALGDFLAVLSQLE